MLILSRRPHESIRIGDDIQIEVLTLSRKGLVHLGISAPKTIPIYRDEIYQRILQEASHENLWAI